MLSLTINQLFGEGAYQDTERLYIKKSSLLGLTPKLDNTAESIAAAIWLTALQSFVGKLTDENNQVITDEKLRPITFDNSEAYELLKIIPWKAFYIKKLGNDYKINQVIIFIYAKV